jgi:cellulose synthase/poly-beta-1,6-N-acetylglucosamine synthase-like glycosyltransferase
VYGFYNVGIVIFAYFYRRDRLPFLANTCASASNLAVALLYTTCNDFIEASAYSCVNQDYPSFTVYILDDSTDSKFQTQIDHFADRFSEKVCVVRRPNRQGFKAGNLNYALSHFAVNEPLFAIADADEILPRDFLKLLVPILVEDKQCGFVQANHCCNPIASNLLREVLGIGIDIHWRWYQPLRNKYGFVMLLGHGAVLRRACWEKVGGFPEVVSEDIAYAIRLKDEGWYGRFAEDLTCYEEFPESVRSFRIRHMKWTRGTCELLATELKRLFLSKKISLVEKLDIFFPILNLPFCTIFLPLALSVGLIFQYRRTFPVTASVGEQVFVVIDLLSMPRDILIDPGFLLINLLTLIAPILCFILELYRRPIYLLRFLCSGFILYAGSFPLSVVGVLMYLVTGKAIFLVTGDQNWLLRRQSPGALWKIKNYFEVFLYQSHPDHSAVQSCETMYGLAVLGYGFLSFQVSLIGLGLTYLFLPLLHHIGWQNPVIQRLVPLPFCLICMDLIIGGFVLLLRTY